jgi:hypothetical protein
VRKSPDASTVVAESTAVATPGRAGDRQRNEQMSLSAMAKERLLVYSDTLSSALASFEQAFVQSSNFQKRKEACARMDSTYLTALRSSMAVAVARRKIVGPLDPVIQRRADDDAERVRMLSIRKSTMCGK